jgi:hypothetical protein
LLHYVQYPVRGLQLQQHGITKNTAYRLNVSISQGTAVQFRILINGIPINYTYDESNKLVQTNLLNGQAAGYNSTVEVYAWNHLSSTYLLDTFAVVAPIINPQIRASTTNIAFPGPIMFEYSMESGSDITIGISFGDTTTDNSISCHYNGDYPTNQWTSCLAMNHTFLIPGTITVIVTFSNAISATHKYLTVTLTTSVNPIQVRTILQLPSQACSVAFIDNIGIASFMIEGTNISAKPASNAQVLIVPDAINRPTFTQGPFALGMDYFSTPSVTSSGLNILYTSPGK